jgi:hypothetical protein
VVLDVQNVAEAVEKICEDVLKDIDELETRSGKA